MSVVSKISFPKEINIFTWQGHGEDIYNAVLKRVVKCSPQFLFQISVFFCTSSDNYETNMKQHICFQHVL